MKDIARRRARAGNDNAAPASISQCRHLVSCILGGAIFVYAMAIIIWEKKHLNFRHYSSLEDAFPHFLQQPGTRKKAKSPVGDSARDGTRIEHDHINMKEKIMKHYRTPVEILKSAQLPDWVKQYALWHKEQRQRYLDAIEKNSTADDIRFLISRCLINDHCGGASDRLQDMPYNLMIANQTQRVLLIKWEKPARLEHYLVPPAGGIDWTIPDGMFKDGENWHLKGKETGQDRIVSTIRRDSAAPIFRKYEIEVVGHKM